MRALYSGHMKNDESIDIIDGERHLVVPFAVFVENKEDGYVIGCKWH